MHDPIDRQIRELTRDEYTPASELDEWLHSKHRVRDECDDECSDSEEDDEQDDE